MRRKVTDLAIEFILKLSIEKLRKLTVEELAKVLGIDRDYLSRKFKKEQNISCADFILREKLHRAYFTLTEESGVSIDNLSDELGFSNCEDFSVEFEKYHAITPERYKDIIERKKLQ